MRVLIQRVTQASVSEAGVEFARIAHGLVLLVGVGHGDTLAQADWLAGRVAGLRVFEDSAGKTNLSVIDVGGSALVISQFTLYADTHKGRRPSFLPAAAPELAEPLVQHFAAGLLAAGVAVQHGRFGAHMQVALVNDGPVTIWLEREAGSAD